MNERIPCCHDTIRTQHLCRTYFTAYLFPSFCGFFVSLLCLQFSIGQDFGNFFSFFINLLFFECAIMQIGQPLFCLMDVILDILKFEVWNGWHTWLNRNGRAQSYETRYIPEVRSLLSGRLCHCRVVLESTFVSNLSGPVRSFSLLVSVSPVQVGPVVRCCFGDWGRKKVDKDDSTYNRFDLSCLIGWSSVVSWIVIGRWRRWQHSNRHINISPFDQSWLQSIWIKIILADDFRLN